MARILGKLLVTLAATTILVAGCGSKQAPSEASKQQTLRDARETQTDAQEKSIKLRQSAVANEANKSSH